MEQMVKLDKLAQPIFCGPGEVVVESKRLRYVKEQYEDRVWLVNGNHKLCLHVSYRQGGNSKPIRIVELRPVTQAEKRNV